ncbi:hypothetical protein CYG49_04735 [Candidatus Saccharibacteria bacterium]|nr:MAG: hypothetical protein CYG49_04735 [Candidatus Saccharibacteria bacterium]
MSRSTKKQSDRDTLTLSIVVLLVGLGCLAVAVQMLEQDNGLIHAASLAVFGVALAVGSTVKGYRLLKK